MLRRRRESSKPDPFAGLGVRWRVPLEQAHRARERFATLAQRTEPGPLRDRLDVLASRLDAGVATAVDIATRADETETTLRELGPDDAGDRLKQARRRLAQLPDADPRRARVEQEVAHLAEQFGSLNRLRNGLDAAADRLAELELRMETAVARAAELSLSPGSFDETALDDVVEQLAALQSAMEELRRP